MATFTSRGPYKYQAQLRRKSYPHQTKTFESTREAEDSAAEVELEMRQRVFVDRSEAERTTFGDISERYRMEVTPSKRGWQAENSRLNQLLSSRLATWNLSNWRSDVSFRTYVFAVWRSAR
ncbi:hypothetical protein [Duganella lactea]|uniref:hypothetical protein n=1 Tax=Duganella lactea TaxID=2692173 RepID=UPI00192705F5|nr:hypothetical protein [Duganella lactea]